MPELPEVESIRTHLSENLKAQPTIKELIFLRKDLRSPMPVALKLELKNQKILEITRRAKFLLIRTETRMLISHLGMSGHWRFEKIWERRTHDHIAMELSDGRFLIYQDPRRFGVFEASKLGEENKNKWLKNLGVEPLSKEWTAELFFQRSRKKRSPIKNLLLDQSVVVGLGNIYVAEALFKAGVRPSRLSLKITKAEAQKIVEASREVLEHAIRFGGTTLRDYLRPNGEQGEFKNRLQVYDRRGELCLVCKSTTIRKTVQSGRSTYFCSICQK